MNMNELKQDALASLKELLPDYDDSDECINEIADGQVPIYYSDMADMLADDPELGFPDDDWCGHAKSTAFDIIAWNIYNELVQYLYEELDN